MASLKQFFDRANRYYEAHDVWLATILEKTAQMSPDQ